MLLQILFILAAVLLLSVFIWCLHACLLLPIRSGACETISVSITAHGDAPELEQQLRALLWLRSNGIIPCNISVCDAGLTAEAAAVVRRFSAENGIFFSDERGLQIHGR